MCDRLVATASAVTWRQSRDAEDHMQKAFSFSCWGGRQINSAGRLEAFKNMGKLPAATVNKKHLEE